ncbi:MAG TPA: hypothetical protein VKP88_02950 [Candidatus Paceibacterota bacterium]|nr:hypothetical protein [Candidatus Paceibacterota bacterium]
MPRKKVEPVEETFDAAADEFDPADFEVEEPATESPKDNNASVVLLMLLCCLLPAGGFLAGAQYVSVTGPEAEALAQLQETVAVTEEQNIGLLQQLEVVQAELGELKPPGGPSCSQAQDPTIYFNESDIRCNQTTLAGLDLSSYIVNNTETVARYQSLTFPEPGAVLTGEFALAYDPVFTQFALTFYPDVQSAQQLETDAELLVVPYGNAVFDLLPENTCDTTCQDELRDEATTTEPIRLTGGGAVLQIERVLHTIAADSLGSTIEFADLSLTTIPEE